MKTGAKLIAKERKEQIEKHGYDSENDAYYYNGELIDAATRLIDGSRQMRNAPPNEWDEEIWQKMFDKPYKDRLIIAGALIAAEIDRLQNT